MSAIDWGLEGKAVLVTGASSGIGAAAAAVLGAAGARVALVGRDKARLEQSKAAVEGAGGVAVTIEADLVDLAAAEAAVDAAVDAFGRLRGLVHCASIFDGRPLEEITIESFEHQWRANVAAPLFMTRRAVPHLEEDSSVVLVASTTALAGFAHSSAYSATKGALVSLGRALAVELARKAIRVNTVVPGYVQTPMLEPLLRNEGFETWVLANTPQGRIGTASELANAILFMVSGLSSYVDGTTLVVDGGWTSR